ncbi:Methionine synthase I, cobalamin-binding domain protein [Desulfamplus magnetovallimortis]|uniref:Methionine synthase I, cobalamin-binding domain protein n=1 Tax=Desulfamplus magnetovallimortis TaxID=1246637 RepID=A0A1W1H705_9BACT|nr:homocysteine S-methyltransferase family protein [Desulfamplus magnetovallimortis]SLM28261.1 Methionine synthase I, cobalamin-binding domain protein [Desulfamplus magnetovallimortis]
MNILDRVKEKGLIFDGAMGSMLMQAGLKGGKASEIWNIEKPEEIQKIHSAYFDAGADVATINTFGASAFKLMRMGVIKELEQDETVKKINSAAVKIACEAALEYNHNNSKCVSVSSSNGSGGGNISASRKYVAGDIGPLGEMLQPAGVLSFEEAVAHFERQARYIVQSAEESDSFAGVDCFIAETFFDLNEVLAAIKGIRKISSLPIFATMTFQKKPSGFFTIMGNKPVESMKKMLDAGASVVGANCSIASDTMIDLAHVIRDGIDAPMIIQPNAGAPSTIGESIVYPETPEFFCENIKKLKDIGVNVVGGCCGTTPDFIRKISQMIHS